MGHSVVLFVLLLTGSAGSVFISYNHGSWLTVFKVRDRLRAAGFVVWIDEDEMCTWTYLLSYLLTYLLTEQRHDT